VKFVKKPCNHYAQALVFLIFISDKVFLLEKFFFKKQFYYNIWEKMILKINSFVNVSTTTHTSLKILEVFAFER